ncbi:MAG: response regulator [Deltaproteobacteria bacterium]|nr:response regulator [Deltaproteobacteria bacterium]
MATQTNRVLVVDDEIAAGKSIEKILSKRGFQVDIAMSADDGINKIEKGLFELVLLDIMMPQVSGIECLKIIKKRWPLLNVLMITGYPSIDTAVEATRLGALDYIPKPFTPQELREKVDDALRTRGPARVIPLRPVEEAAAICPLGGQVCEIYNKKGRVCKTKDGICPKIKKAELKEKRWAGCLAEEIGRAAVDIDMPFSHEDVARYAGPTYAQALAGSDLPLVNWGREPEVAAPAFPEILVIDDEVVVGNSVRKILEPRGYHVVHAQTPQDAMETLSSVPVDMILLDMKIPGVRGLEFLEAIREEHPTTPVIMVTGYASVETAVESMKIGATDYVPKPFTPKELHGAVEKGLRRAA